ncbi:MAG: thioredoxin [Nitrospinae bacterium]|nr:thioredoxin [Nitrospinota bacterium]
MSKVVHVNDDNFQTEVLNSDIPVLVDFWAAWCGPCRMIAPIIEELAGEYAGKVKIAKCDTEAAYQIPARYGIRGIPTLILFKNGKVANQIVGAVPKPALVDFIDSAAAVG